MFKSFLFTILFVISSSAIADSSPTAIDQAMYFKSHVTDASHCQGAMQAKDGKIAFTGVSNPALTCPDAYAWKQFMEAVSGEFWRNWSTDQQIWVAKPKALCSSKQSTDCCRLDKSDGNVTYIGSSKLGDAHCPLYPAVIGGMTLTQFADKHELSPHLVRQAQRLDDDTSRIARDTEAEIVYHNKPFFNFSVANNLYHTNGLAEIFKKQQFEAENQAPYRPQGQGVSYPEEAVMFKVDFLAESVMLELGYISDHDSNPATPPNNAKHPYITMQIEDPDTKKNRRHYLVAVTGASKALPNWHWYAFEHVNNIGRCDYIGCNDSYGFSREVDINMPDGTKNRLRSHYIPPHQTTTELGDTLFVRNEKYASAEMNSPLADLFKGMSVGQGAYSVSSKTNPMPATDNAAWQSYRLKGTQVNYYHNDGTPVLLGASVTEGGFVNTASCMSCHVQASVDNTGSAASGPVGGTLRLSLDGIPKVTHGAPDRNVFYKPGSTSLNAARVDFVWGILNASPLAED